MKQKPNRAKKRNPADVPQYGLRKIRRLLREHGEWLRAVSVDLGMLNGRLADMEFKYMTILKPMTKRGRR